MSFKNKLLITFLIGLLFLLRWLTLPSLPDFESGQEVRITGFLREEPKIIGSSQRFSLVGIEIKTFLYPEYFYGDDLTVTGILEEKYDRFFLDYPEIETTQIQKKGIEQKILGSISGKVLLTLRI